MRGKGFWRFETALLVCLSLVAPALAAESDDDVPKAALKDSEGSGWFGKWFHSSPKEEADKKPGTKKKAAEKKSDPEDSPSAPVVAHDDGSAHARAIFLRRLAVCLQIKEIAEQTNDAALQQQAEQLDQRVWEAYSRQTERNPSPQAGSEKSLDKEKGGHTEAGLSANTAGKNERTSHTALREEVP